MNEHDELMQQITAALETPSHVRVPIDFAARVMARVPQQSTRRVIAPAVPRARYGRYTVAAAMLLLLAALILFAPATHSSVLWISLQTMLFTQLAAFVLWFSWLRRT